MCVKKKMAFFSVVMSFVNFCLLKLYQSLGLTGCYMLQEFLPGGAARSIIDALLREANSNITCPKNAINAAPDALRMMTALNALSKAANDAQQRGWALHDDAHDIQTQLLELISVMVS